MNSPAPASETQPGSSLDVAILPRQTIGLNELGQEAAQFDGWLRTISQQRITLDSFQHYVKPPAVMGNIMAALDVLINVATLSNYRSARQRQDFVPLGINLIGLLSGNPDESLARMVLRPMLFIGRQALSQGDPAELDDGTLEVLKGHLNASIRGELPAYLDDAHQRLPDLLQEAATLGKGIVLALADGLESAAKAGPAPNLPLEVSSQLYYEPTQTIDNLVQAAWQAYQAAESPALPQTAEAAEPSSLAARVAGLRALASELDTQLPNLAQAGTVHNSVESVLAKMSQSAKDWSQRRSKGQSANVKPEGTSQARRQSGEGHMEALSLEFPASGDCNECLNGTCAGTGDSISFARGTERVVTMDTSLPGPFPFVWARTYRSDLSAYDDGPLGARWTNPYLTYLDITHSATGQEQLDYHAADGRTHAYPLPAIGKKHYDPIERLMLVRTTAHELIVGRGQIQRETYQRVGSRFRLTGIHLRGGARLALQYGHTVENRQVLSDLITYQDDIPHTHVGTQLDAQGRILGLWQIAEGKLLRQLARYQYDDAGDLVQAEDEHGKHWTYQYQHHLITRYTDRTGRGTNLQWDGALPTAKAIREWADDGSFDTQLHWDANIRATYMTNALGHQTAHYYDRLGYTYRIRHADGRSEWFFRDEAKRLVRHVHTTGHEDRYAYDERGNLLEHIQPDGSVLHYAYDDADQLFKTRDAEGGVWKRAYDPRGNVIEAIDPRGNTTQYAYDPSGNLTEIIDAKGGKKQIAYNANGQMTQYTDCSGKCSLWSYDTLNQLTASTDAAGNTTRYVHEAGQLATVLHPDGSEEQFERDAEGRLLRYTDALGRATHWYYSAAGLLTRRVDAQGNTLDYEWDKLGRLHALSNENGRSMRFEHDPAGRLLGEIGFDAQRTTYHYHSSSGVLAYKENGLRVTSYDFDAMGRMTERRAGQRPGPNASPPSWQREHYAYDNNGQALLATNSEMRLQWFYDEAGNLIREHQHYLALSEPKVAVWRHEYDVLNQRCTTIRPDGQREDVLRYGSGHVHGVLLNQRELVSLERDDLHREVRRDQGNALTQTQAWDPMGRLAEQTLRREATAERHAHFLSRRGFTYDAASQLTGIDDLARGVLAYHYDPVGRLIQANSNLGQESFAFDPAGNMLDASRAPTDTVQSHASVPVYTYRRTTGVLDNLLREYAGTHYSYDAYGNLSERLRNGVRSRFTWDGFDRLIQYEDERVQVTFYYDALNRRQMKDSRTRYRTRVQETKQWNEQQHAQQDREQDCGLTLYGWSGDTLAWESRNGRTTHYLYEPESFVPLAQAVSHQRISLHTRPVYGGHYDIEQDPLWTTVMEPAPMEALAWYQVDHLGTPQELTDEAGELAWSAQYKAWGEAKEVLSEAANRAGIKNPLRFQGQYFDHETGLHYNRHRYYDPQVGRYISKDPIGYAGGINLFDYANGNPLSLIDPLGLQAIPLPPIPIPGVPNPSIEAQKDLATQLTRSWNRQRTYQTYTRFNPASLECYSGRTSGYADPETNVQKRGSAQADLNAEGFMPPVLDKSSANKDSIRGREQQIIDANGGARVWGGTSRNMINGISKANMARPIYIRDAVEEFGYPVSNGQCTFQ